MQPPILNLEAPQRIALEPTNICNMRCRMCFREFLPSRPGFMDLGTLEQTLVPLQASAGPIPQICFFWRGEPLLHDSLDSLVRRAVTLGHITILFTNGVLASRDRSTGLFATGLHKLIFSVDSLDPDIYKRIRGTDCLAHVVENIRGAVALRDAMRSDCQIGVNLTILRENVRETQAFLQFWREIVDTVSVSLGVDPSRLTGIKPVNPRVLSAVEGASEIIACHKIEETRPEVCQFVRNRLWISWDGDVFPCPMGTNAIRLGNVHDRRLAEIWRGRRHRALVRYQQRRGRCGSLPCARCTLRQL